jgi:hypothetical protein
MVFDRQLNDDEHSTRLVDSCSLFIEIQVIRMLPQLRYYVCTACLNRDLDMDEYNSSMIREENTRTKQSPRLHNHDHYR